MFIEIESSKKISFLKLLRCTCLKGLGGWEGDCDLLGFGLVRFGMASG